MKIAILSEYGYDEALFGLGLSFGKTSNWDFKKFNWTPTYAQIEERAYKLTGLGKGHDKFLRMLMVTLDIAAPLYWWKQFDTYKIGTVTQSESTMHTLMKHPITSENFAGGMSWIRLWGLNRLRKKGAFESLNALLPQAYLQQRIVQTNYAVLRNILEQRKGHKLPEWKAFCNKVSNGTKYRELLI